MLIALPLFSRSTLSNLGYETHHPQRFLVMSDHIKQQNWTPFGDMWRKQQTADMGVQERRGAGWPSQKIFKGWFKIKNTISLASFFLLRFPRDRFRFLQLCLFCYSSQNWQISINILFLMKLFRWKSFQLIRFKHYDSNFSITKRSILGRI